MASGGSGVREEWSWSDSDGEGGPAASPPRAADGAPADSQRGMLPRSLQSSSAGLVASEAGSTSSKKSVKAGVRQMVALGMCSPQAAERFLQMESDARELPAAHNSGASKDQLVAAEARLAASERALQQSEQEQARLQTELLRLTLNAHQDSSSSQSGGVTAFDVARARREAEKVMALQRKVAESEERERQQAMMQAKMEELLRLQEVALSEREDSAGTLEKEMSERDAKLRLLSEQLSQAEQVT
jgi:hypothetical protein